MFSYDLLKLKIQGVKNKKSSQNSLITGNQFNNLQYLILAAAMSSFNSISDKSTSRRSSGAFDILGLSFGENNSENNSSAQLKLTQMMDWFKSRNIIAGDPLSIQEQHLRNSKNKIAMLVNQQNKQNSFQSKRLGGGIRNKLSIQTKF